MSGKVASEKDLDAFILAYMSQRGYVTAVQSLRSDRERVRASRQRSGAEPVEDGPGDADVVKRRATAAIASVEQQLLFFDSRIAQEHSLWSCAWLSGAGAASAGTDPSSAAEYAQLVDYVMGCLDLYKQELSAMLYPVWAHCFLSLVDLCV